MAKRLLDRLKDIARGAQGGVSRAIQQARSHFVNMLGELTGKRENDADVFKRAYRDHGPRLSQSRTPSFNVYANTKSDRLVNRLGPKHLGRLIMFIYDPKYKETLPYFDRLPLVLPLSFEQGGKMLGLNLHYLPPKLRAALMDELIENVITPKFMDERKRIRISYDIMKNAASSSAYAPCIKKYIISPNHVKSRFLVIPPTEWAEVIMLPFERFEKADKNTVYRDSLRTIRKR